MNYKAFCRTALAAQVLLAIRRSGTSRLIDYFFELEAHSPLSLNLQPIYLFLQTPSQRDIFGHLEITTPCSVWSILHTTVDLRDMWTVYCPQYCTESDCIVHSSQYRNKLPSTVECSAVMFCRVQYGTVLYCPVLYSTVLYCPVLYNVAMMHCP